MVERPTKPECQQSQKVYYVQVEIKRRNEYSSLVPSPVRHPSFDGDIADLVATK